MAEPQPYAQLQMIWPERLLDSPPTPGVPQGYELRCFTEADEPGFVVVDVTDSGHGIPPEMIDKIWVAFYTTKGDRGGTGLGLAACAQIIGQLGGKILVESEVGVGTTFSVLLPVAAEPGADAEGEM